MKSKIYSLTLAIALLLLANENHAQVIVVQHGGTASVFSTLDSAMEAASAGDYLYLSGGLFFVHGHQSSGTDSTHFYKPLHLVGAGISADSTSVTGQTRVLGTPNPSDYSDDINISSTADGSTFDGIYFAGGHVSFETGNLLPDSSGHFTFNRCFITNLNMSALGGGPNPGSFSVECHECIIPVGVSSAGAGSNSASFDRCIVSSNSQSLSAGIIWTNCILASNPGAGTVNNCIIYSPNFVNESGAVYNNCLFGGVQPGPSSDVFNNCLFNVNVNDSTVFVNAPTQTFDWSYDYHLAVGSPAINYGNDGHDCGIYGSATPTKPGWVPYNPHFTGATVPVSTDPNGNLTIDIHVAAQPY